MTTEHWARVEELFHTALSLDAAERIVFLVASCGDDAQLLREVKRLLRAHPRSRRWFNRGMSISVRRSIPRRGRTSRRKWG